MLFITKIKEEILKLNHLITDENILMTNSKQTCTKHEST